MADSKISALPASAGLVGTDLFAVVDDPAGTPATQKATFNQLTSFLSDKFGTLTVNVRVATPEVLIGGTANQIDGLSTSLANEALVIDALTLESVFSGPVNITSTLAVVGDVGLGNGSLTIAADTQTLSFPGQVEWNSGQSVLQSNGSIHLGGNTIVLSGVGDGTAQFTGLVELAKVNVNSGMFKVDENDGVGFFGEVGVSQQLCAALSNDVASGGTDNVIDNYADLTTYSNSAAAIRNNFYQLARKVKEISDALRAFGLLGD